MRRKYLVQFRLFLRVVLVDGIPLSSCTVYRYLCGIFLDDISTMSWKLQNFFSKTETKIKTKTSWSKTKTKNKTFIFVLEAPRDQDPLEDYITVNTSIKPMLV